MEKKISAAREEEIWKKLKDLPESIRGVLFAPQTTDALYTIAEDNNLVEKIETLELSMNLVLSGAVHITKFRETLQKELQIDENRARIIATEIRDTIFVQVKDELRKIHNLK